MSTINNVISGLLSGTISQIIFFVVTVLVIAGTWRIFVKMGERGWKCLIPLYNEYVVFGKVWNTRAFWIMIALSIAAGIGSGIAQILYEGGQDSTSLALGVFALFLLLVSIAWQIRFCRKVTKSFGKGVGMTIVLVIFPFVATLILGFGSAQFRAPSK